MIATHRVGERPLPHPEFAVGTEEALGGRETFSHPVFTDICCLAIRQQFAGLWQRLPCVVSAAAANRGRIAALLAASAREPLWPPGYELQTRKVLRFSRATHAVD